ncbi:hypothetical protein BCR33DRAFT_426430 [Rhizoclosmatium globosum]|uniref:N-acetyltransferase domain-containing protein n=1 Tax=Rhizoclosmatium globosum TaxID=329046 RepID=A0A1Y2BV38_9FUNG|nr:hypothetical protein BCR33DRAFT_426430 [Rhizoclosmatium globosum]|eukprot:ORY38603.1 hypothetical protein BCR33DRAFT_426430 [Rhizoclosmatium globosum]
MEEYTFSSLTDAQIPLLLDHLAAVFDVVNPVTNQRGAPRAFFEHHWEEDFDSSRTSSAVFVAWHCNQIVASVRVYSRSLRIGSGNKSVAAGGIGDVATQVNHRGKGLAKKLLAMAEDYASTRYKIMTLHASAMGLPVYEAVGWRNVDMHTRILTTTSANIMRSNGSSIQSINFNDPYHLALIEACHKFVSQVVLGSFERCDDKHYWKGYVGSCRDIRRYPTRLLFTSSKKPVSDLAQGDLVGYIICDLFKHEVEKALSDPFHIINIQLRDLFWAKVDSGFDGTKIKVNAPNTLEFGCIISDLVSSAIIQLLEPWFPDVAQAKSRKVKLNYPAALLPDKLLDCTSLAWLSQESRENAVDVGMMYKILHPFTAESPAGELVEVEDITGLRKVFQPLLPGQSVSYVPCKGVELQNGTPMFGFFKSDAY